MKHSPGSIFLTPTSSSTSSPQLQPFHLHGHSFWVIQHGRALNFKKKIRRNNINSHTLSSSSSSAQQQQFPYRDTVGITGCKPRPNGGGSEGACGGGKGKENKKMKFHFKSSFHPPHTHTLSPLLKRIYENPFHCIHFGCTFISLSYGMAYGIWSCHDVCGGCKGVEWWWIDNSSTS